MSASYVVSLALVVLALVLLRVVGVLPVRTAARRLGRVDGLIAFIGVVGLLFHCSAMFFPALGRAVPGGAALSPAVNALGPASIALYTAPALLVLIGLRRLHPVAVAVDAVALVAVGVTMYDGGPLIAHLTAIAVSVVALAVTGLAFVGTGSAQRLSTASRPASST